MRRIKGGFTLIEVSLFLAITGLLFIGVTLGVQNSVFRQRYNDSIQNFAEFLRGVYDKVMNVQNANSNGGKSSYALYGKLVTFGEDDDSMVYVYDVAGIANSNASVGKTKESLKKGDGGVGIDVVDSEGGPYGVISSYKPKWSAEIQNTCSESGGCDESSFSTFKGMLLVVRHPRSGTVQTFVNVGEVIKVRQKMQEGKTSILQVDEGGKHVLDGFDFGRIDFCINPNGNEENNIRADVMIPAKARNSSGIEILMDSDDNRCRSRE